MRIQDVMTTEIISISGDAVVNDAREVLRRNRIHHLIVLDGKKIIGVISDRDLADRDGDTPVADVMTKKVATISPRATVRQAAGKLNGRTIGCLPVINRGKLAGIVTTSDVVRAMSKGTHAPPPRERFILSKRGPRKRPMPR